MTCILAQVLSASSFVLALLSSVLLILKFSLFPYSTLKFSKYTKMLKLNEPPCTGVACVL